VSYVLIAVARSKAGCKFDWEPKAVSLYAEDVDMDVVELVIELAETKRWAVRGKTAIEMIRLRTMASPRTM